jgi:pheromone shutdown-related protein TraB
MNLDIIGTSHIARESLKEVKDAINTEKYDIIALELDPLRMQALLSKKKQGVSIQHMFRVGVKGYIFSLFGAWAEKKLGQVVGMKPGAEMLTAYRLAKKKKLKIALIDQRIDITLKKFSKALTWREKWHFVVDVVKGFFKRPQLEFDLRTVPSKKVVAKLIKRVKKRYPNFYKVLVADRNKVMAQNLSQLVSRYPGKRILAIVGAGHEEDIMNIVDETPKISYSFSFG